MYHTYEQIEIDALTQLYREKEDALTAVLISGTSWNEVKEDRNELTDLAAAILDRHFPSQPFLRETFKYQIEEKIALQVVKARSSWSLKKLMVKWAYLVMAFPLALLLFIALRIVFYMSSVIKMVKRLIGYNPNKIIVDKN